MAALTYEERQRLPKRDFVFPKSRSYPIDTRNRARNALARVSRYGTPYMKAKVWKRVHSRYPEIDAPKRLRA